jgi:hypothetical protein
MELVMKLLRITGQQKGRVFLLISFLLLFKSPIMGAGI